MEYLLKASVVIAIFYLCFHLLLKKETFFNQNRWFLLIGIVIALIFPFLVIPVQIAIEPIIATDNSFVITENSLSVLPVSTPEASFEWQSLLPIIYSLGFLIFTIQFLLQFGSLIWLLLKNPKNKDGIYTYVIVNNNISPFSFFKWIVYNPESFTQSELDLMMTHEKVHASQLHSIDILLIQLACSIFWFNPFIWFYRKEVRQNLEYIADSKTQASINNQKEYQRLLLKTSVANHNISFSNNFYNSSIKKRILMLKQSKSNKQRQWKYLLILPLLAGLLMSMNTETIYVETNETDTILKSSITTEADVNARHIELINSSNTVELVVTKNTTNRELASMTSAIEEKGGTLVFSQVQRNTNNEITNLFLKLNNHSYGSGNSKNGIDAFIIYKEFSGLEGGYVGRLNGATLHFNNPEKIHDKEAISALKKRARNAILKLGIQTKEELEEFENKKAEHKNKKSNKKEDRQTNIGTIHVNNDGDDIRMDIDTDNNKDSNSIYYIQTDNNGKKGKKSKLLINSKNKKPLYIVDGEILSENDASFVGISAESIKSVNVLKGKDATDKYGEKGKNGVIIITSKTEEELQLETNNPQIKINKSNSKSISTNEGDVITIKESKNDNNLRINSGMYNNPQPLILVDGNEVSKEAMKALNPNHIESMQVFKGNDATEKYGEKGKHGIIEITLKDEKDLDDNISTKNDTEKPTQNKTTKKDNPWKIVGEPKINSLTYIDDEDPSKNGSFAYISKSTPDEILDSHVNELKRIGITVKYSKLKRNKEGKITSIKISLNDNEGRKSSATWKVTNGIPEIEFGKSEGSLIVRTK